VQQLVFAFVMDVQQRDTEIDVISQERDPRGDGTGAARTSREDSSYAMRKVRWFARRAAARPAASSSRVNESEHPHPLIRR
jgi:hypothetical protein